MKRIPLTQGKFAIVDTDDYDYLIKWKWYAVKTGQTYYAARAQSCKTRRKIWMHREIMQILQGRETDHRNHNGLDNRRVNLRECSRAENQYNQLPMQGATSKFKGVCWDRGKGKWFVRIGHNGKSIFIGRYDLEEDAVAAYDKKAIELFGEFAYTNFPGGVPVLIVTPAGWQLGEARKVER